MHVLDRRLIGRFGRESNSKLIPSSLVLPTHLPSPKPKTMPNPAIAKSLFNLHEAIDLAKFSSQLQKGVANSLRSLDAFAGTLRKGPGKSDLQNYRNSFKIENREGAKEVRSRVVEKVAVLLKGKELEAVVAREVLSLFELFEYREGKPSSERVSRLKESLVKCVRDGVEVEEVDLRNESTSVSVPPHVRAVLQVETFSIVRPLVKRLLEIMTDQTTQNLWNVSFSLKKEDPRTEELQKKLEGHDQELLNWWFLASVLEAPLGLCYKICEPLLPNRWIRRRLAEDFEYLESASRALLLDRGRLEVLGFIKRTGNLPEIDENDIVGMGLERGWSCLACRSWPIRRFGLPRNRQGAWKTRLAA